MHKAHAHHEWYDAKGHDLVFPEESLIANVAARQTETDNDEGEDGTPPAVEEGRVIGCSGAAFWW